MGIGSQTQSESLVVHNINQLIDERGTSKHAVQQASGIARNTFYDKMANRPDAFTLGQLGRIARVLGVSLARLTEGA